MQTAVTPANGSDLLLYGWEPSDPKFQYYTYFYFADVEENQANQTRNLDIYVNGRLWYGPFIADYLYAFVTYSIISISEDKYEFSFKT